MDALHIVWEFVDTQRARNIFVVSAVYFFKPHTRRWQALLVHNGKHAILGLPHLFIRKTQRASDCNTVGSPRGTVLALRSKPKLNLSTPTGGAGQLMLLELYVKNHTTPDVGTRHGWALAEYEFPLPQPQPHPQEGNPKPSDIRWRAVTNPRSEE